MKTLDNRTKALQWFNSMAFEEQYNNTIEYNHLITGDHTRHPSTLTGSEIETIYNAVQGNTHSNIQNAL